MGALSELRRMLIIALHLNDSNGIASGCLLVRIFATREYPRQLQTPGYIDNPPMHTIFMHVIDEYGFLKVGTILSLRVKTTRSYVEDVYCTGNGTH